jgi:GT2 family glycosyltransferase
LNRIAPSPEFQLPASLQPPSAESDRIAAASVAVVIVNYRTPELTKRCVAALAAERERLPRLRAAVVDGGSGDASPQILAKALAEPEYADWVSFLPLAINGGYGWANNQAILRLAGEKNSPEFIHILNPDAEVSEDAVARLVGELQAHPRCGAAGSQLLAPGGHAVASAFRFPSAGREFVAAARSEAIGRMLGIAPMVVRATESTEVDWVSGASVMFRSEALRDAGLFDDGFFLYFEEVELMHRMSAKGWSVRHVPESRVVHVEGASTGGPAARAQPRAWYESRRRYFALTSGRSSLVGVNLAWLVGRAAGIAKNALRASADGDGMRSGDLLRFGFWPGASRPSVPSWGEPPGRPPAWMERR